MLHNRRLVRTVLFVIAGNAVVLAVFGTFQKLVHAKGLWLGLVHSPNDKFFSTFIYHNHWGAFTLLNTAVCLGLLFHFLRRGGQRDIWHSPVLLGALVTLLLAASVPLSSSRSCTALIGVLLFGALVHFLARLIRRRREHHESVLLPVTGIILAALLAVGAIGWLGRDVIAQRMRLTSEQLAHIAKEDTLNSRLTLYRDTWRMAAEKPWFGWGLESYAHVFRTFNTQRAAEIWIWIPFYAEAHNDWLQSLAEVGFVGTGLLATAGGHAVPRRALAPCRVGAAALPARRLRHRAALRVGRIPLCQPRGDAHILRDLLLRPPLRHARRARPGGGKAPLTCPPPLPSPSSSP